MLSHVSTILKRVGRGPELDELTAFLAEERAFTWWMWTGPAGVGKSRLAVELCRLVSDDGDAGFLADTQQSPLGGFRPVSPTLAVVDCAGQRADWLSDMPLDLPRRKGLRAVVSSARNFEKVEQTTRQMLIEVGSA